MRVLPQQQAPAPAPPRISITGSGTAALPQNVSRPMTREDVQLLQNRRNELSRQLTSASGRRSDVVREMGRSANGRDGLDARLKVLDERIVQLEKDISQNGQLLASAPPNLVEETSPPMVFPPAGRSVNINGLSAGLLMVVVLPLVVTWCIRTLRRAPKAPPALPPESVDRIARIELAVDSIALEVERISEGQRFVTKLMSEPRQLGEGAAEPIILRQGDKVPVARAEG